MAVYKRSYKIYDGSRTPAGLRFSVLTRFAFRSLFQSRIFTGFVVLCLFPFLIGAAEIYIVHSETVKLLFNLHIDSIVQINNAWFAAFLRVMGWLGFMIVATAAPGMVTRDFANQALQLYLSRPLSRTEYILGKLSVLALLLSITTWIPGLLLFALQASLEGHGWAWDNFYLVGAILVSGWLWIAVVSLFALALSVWVRWRIAATALIVGTIFFLPGFGEIFNFVMGVKWGNLLNLSYDMRVVWAGLYRLSPEVRSINGLDDVPQWTAWAALLALCAMSILLLNRKLKAREVERG